MAYEAAVGRRVVAVVSDGRGRRCVRSAGDGEDTEGKLKRGVIAPILFGLLVLLCNPSLSGRSLLLSSVRLASSMASVLSHQRAHSSIVKGRGVLAGTLYASPFAFHQRLQEHPPMHSAAGDLSPT